MASVLTVNEQNLHACIAALRELDRHLEEFARLTKRYPVEVEFGGMRFVFQSRKDIDELRAGLRQQINAFAVP